MGQVTNCVLDGKTIQPEQPPKQLSVTSSPRFAQTVSLSSGFSKLSVLDPLSSPKPKSLHNFVTLSRENSKRVASRCAAPRTTKKLLRLVSHHTPNALPCLSRVPATSSLSIHWDPQPACRPHAHQCKCPAPCSQTNKDRAHLERNRILSICSAGIACQRLRDVRRPSMALRTFHTTRLPSIRVFGAVHTAVRLRGLQR